MFFGFVFCLFWLVLSFSLSLVFDGLATGALVLASHAVSHPLSQRINVQNDIVVGIPEKNTSNKHLLRIDLAVVVSVKRMSTNCIDPHVPHACVIRSVTSFNLPGIGQHRIQHVHKLSDVDPKLTMSFFNRQQCLLFVQIRVRCPWQWAPRLGYIFSLQPFQRRL